MKAEIWGPMGEMRTITSRDPKLVGQWFAEQATELITANATVPEAQIRIWPSTPEEQQALCPGWHELAAEFTQGSLLALAEAILTASKKLGEIEDARALRAR